MLSRSRRRSGPSEQQVQGFCKVFDRLYGDFWQKLQAVPVGCTLRCAAILLQGQQKGTQNTKDTSRRSRGNVHTGNELAEWLSGLSRGFWAIVRRCLGEGEGTPPLSLFPPADGRRMGLSLVDGELQIPHINLLHNRFTSI